MTTYFDPTDGNHLKLLPPGIRTAQGLVDAAALAEAAVIGYYTVNPPYFLYTAALANSITLGLWGFTERSLGEDITATGLPAGAVAAQLRVYLTGYKADASSTSADPNLKAALRMTIAQVIRWWLGGWGRAQAVVSSSDLQAKVRAYRQNADDTFPPDWNLLLIPFDCRPVHWGL